MNNQNNHQETDIIVLLDNFKNGIKSIFRRIGKFFKSLFTLVIYFLILVKKYWILVASCVIIFGIVGFFNKNILPTSYHYEMIVQPNYNSSHSLYQIINSCDALSGNPDDAVFKNIKSVKVSPIKSLSEAVNAYYNVIGGHFSENTNFKQSSSRDTLFFKQYKISDFQKSISDKDYLFQKISVKSRIPLTQQQIEEKIIAPLQKDFFYRQYRDSYMRSIDLQSKYYTLNMQRIDTLLLALAKEGTSKALPQSSLILNGESKTSIEADLLEQSRNFSSLLADLEMQKNLYSDVIRIIAPPSRVFNDVVKINTTTCAFYGLIFSLLIIFGIQIAKYLKQYEKEHV